jgi:hypothetical protein
MEYPNTIAVLENHFVVKGFIPPNGSELMDCYAEAFAKVMHNLDQVLALYEKTETYVPVAQRMAALGKGWGTKRIALADAQAAA